METRTYATARLTLAAWCLIGGGGAALLIAFVVNVATEIPVVTSVLSPLGWLALVVGIVCAGVVAYRRALARDRS